MPTWEIVAIIVSVISALSILIRCAIICNRPRNNGQQLAF